MDQVHLQYALKRMYEVANEIDEEKETLKGDLAAAEAKLATNDKELQETHEKVSRVRHEEQLLQTTCIRSEHSGCTTCSCYNNM